MTPNLLEKAQDFYKNTPLPQIQDKRRKLYTKELLFVIETAPFLTAPERDQMSNLIPLYPTRTIKKVKENLIRQGIIYLQLNPHQKESVEDWLNKTASQPL